jgi:aminopeptidase
MMTVHMPTDLETILKTYAELTVNVGLNLRAGQRLLIIGPIANGGVSLDAAPLVREVAASAYRAGAELVEACWGDEPLQLVRFRHAPRTSFNHFSRWLPEALREHVEHGGAMLSIYANDPDHLKNEPSDLISSHAANERASVRRFASSSRGTGPLDGRRLRHSGLGGARRRSRARRPRRFAVAEIVSLCRLDRDDPVAAWRTHLGARSTLQILNRSATAPSRILAGAS